VAIGTGAVLGTATVLYIGYKWYKKHQILITVPPGSETPSVEETNALNEANTIRRKMEKIEFKAKARGEVLNTATTKYENFMKSEETAIKGNIDNWSDKTKGMFDAITKEINNKPETAFLTPEIAKTAVESAEEDYMKNNYDGYDGDGWQKDLITYANIAEIVERDKTTLPQNLINISKKFASMEAMATRLATLRKIGLQWDEQKIRQNLNDRKLTINERMVLDTIMAIIEERTSNYSMLVSIHNIKRKFLPDDLKISSF
jgi:hypothetical protein